MPVVRIDLAYDGTDFHGFARQPNVRTVQGDLDDALARVLGDPVETTCAGRTDTGVHARHQIVSFEVLEVPDLERLQRSLNGLVGPEVAVHHVRLAEDGFNARFSPTARSYRYFVDPSPVPDPLNRGWVWHLGRDLDLAAMNESAAALVGRHDFASFCRQREGATTEREVLAAEWVADGNLVVFQVRARAFCHQMVRSLVGHCVDVGLGRVKSSETLSVIAARNRQSVGTVAPPHGLVLWEVSL